MKKFQSIMVVSLASVLLMSACTPVDNTQTGTIAGSVVGGVVGNQFGKGDGKIAATVAGAVLGGYIGGQMGAQMDARDRQYVAQSVASGRPTAWQNSTTGYRYNAQPGQTYKANNTVCRPVTVVGYMNGQQQNIQMRACQNANGQWQAVN